MEWYGIIIIAAILLAVLFLLKKGIITISSLGKMGSAIEQIATVETGESLMSRLIQYANIAFHAAEQLAKIGEIALEQRKETALKLVKQYAATDGTTLTDADVESASTIIEANCDINGHKAEEGQATGDTSTPLTNPFKDDNTPIEELYEKE